jgi:ATP synthase F1 delta subunit
MSEITCDCLYPLFTSIPGRYAKALIYVGIKYDCIKEFEQNFNTLISFMYKNTARTKNNIIYILQKYIYKYYNKFFANFIIVLIKNKKLNLLQNIQYIFHKALLKIRGDREVVVESAFCLNNLEQENINNLISKLFKEKIIVKYEIDKNILTGIKIHSGDLLLDASGRGIIQQLSSSLRKL